MEFLIWLALPIAAGCAAAVVTYLLMRDRIDVAVAQERLLTREAEVLLRATAETAEERIRAAEERAQRKILEKLLLEITFDDRPRTSALSAAAGGRLLK